MNKLLGHLIAIAVFLGVSVIEPLIYGQVAPCGNNSSSGVTTKPPENKGAPTGGDPFNPYTGNEYREIADLKIWGGVGEHQLVWERWANSRFVNGTQYFGNGHNWRHSYQWDFANAGTNSQGEQQFEIVYPDGSDNIFTQSGTTSTSYSPPVGVAETLTQNNNDFYLQRQNGWVYHFTQNTDSNGNFYYLMADFKDSQQNDYVLTYNSAHEVIQVTEPGGRYFQVNYTTVSLNPIPFNTLAAISQTPAQGQYTTVTVTDPTPYRYLRYLGPDGGFDNVAEIQFYDINGRLLKGTPFGTTPPWSSAGSLANAFDGNVNTYVDFSQGSGGYTGIDLGPGNAATISKIVYYPRIGYEYRMDSGNYWQASGQGRFQGSNQAPVSIPIISSVTTNDGRIITYNYLALADSTLPYNYEVLGSVSYDDGTQATYTYSQVFPSTQPLIVAYNDPRNEKSFTRTKTVYYSTQESALGQIYQQVNYDTGEVLYTLQAYQGNLSLPAVTAGNGGTTLYGINHPTGQLFYTTDANGNTTSYAYGPKGFKYLITDALGRNLQRINSSFDNPLNASLPDGSTESWTRDSLDLPLTHTDELGRTQRWNRDSLHRIKQVINPDGSSDSYTYNNFSEVLTHTLRNGFIETNVYSSTGLLTSKTDAQGNTTTYTYDTAGRVATVTDARNNVSAYQYNAKGQIIQIQYADASVHSYTYDIYGNKLSDTDELGNTTSFTYDTFNRLTSKTDAIGRVTQWIYRSSYFVEAGKPDKVILPSGKTEANVYDLENHPVFKTEGYDTPDAATTQIAYDAVYNKVKTIDPKGFVRIFTYDSRNRVVTVTDPLGHTVKFAYDAVSNKTQITRSDGGVTTNSYNSVNNLIQSIDPKGAVTQYAYDLSANLTTRTDARGNSYLYSYDHLNRKTQLVFPDKTAETWAYDPDGNIASMTTREGQVKTSSYDVRNRETSYVWSDSTPAVHRNYDVGGRLLNSTNGLLACSYTYDNAISF